MVVRTPVCLRGRWWWIWDCRREGGREGGRRGCMYTNESRVKEDNIQF